MTEAELVKSLSERFYSDFADTVARRVRDAGAVCSLALIVIGGCGGGGAALSGGDLAVC